MILFFTNFLHPLNGLTIELLVYGEIRKKLVEWIEYSSDLSKHAITAIDPDSTTRGVRPHHSLEEISKYQNITEGDIQVALEELYR